MQEREQQRRRVRALLLTEASKEIIDNSLARLELAGLRLRPNLDRDVIVVRCLCGLAESYGFDDLESPFLMERDDTPRISLDLKTLWELTSEADIFGDFEDAEMIFPRYAALTDDALMSLFNSHKFSVFENAAAVCIVNEDQAQRYMRQQVEALSSLTCGDLQLRSVEASQTADRLVGRVTLVDGRSCDVNFDADKRPDLTPLFKSMNSLAEPAGGRFIVSLTGNSESLVALYMDTVEEDAFRRWAERQYCPMGPAPIDWLE